MNKSNTSQVKFRKKTKFRPIMLTSKSMKPVQRSTADKIKPQDKNDIDDQSRCFSSTKRRQSQNYAIYSNQLTKTQMIKKLTQQYRLELIRNIDKHSSAGKKRSNHKSKPMTPSIVQVQFEDARSYFQNRNRYEKLVQGISSSESQSDTLKKYIYCTNFQNNQNFVNKLKVTRNNQSIAFRNLIKSNKQTEEWTSFLQKYYLNIKKISPENKNVSEHAKVSQEKLNEISVKVQEYQNNLIKKMQERFSVYGSCEQNDSTDPKYNSPSTKAKSNFFANDLQKIEEDILAKRQTSKKEHFVFSMSETNKVNVEQILKQKFQNYKDFLWKINFSNSIYVRLRDEIQPAYKLYVGPGNNSMLIKGIMKRRFWWQVVDKPTDEVHFVWTQIKINDYFKFQMQRRNFITSNRRHLLLKNRNVYSALQQFSNDLTNPKIKQPKQNDVQDTEPNVADQMDDNSKIFGEKDLNLWMNHLKINKKFQDKLENAYPKRIKTMVRKKQLTFIDDSRKLKIQNHFECNYFLGNKKALFYSMRKYYTLLKKDPFQFIPLTFHISKGIEDQQYMKFLEKYEEFQVRKKNRELQNIWIVKPGEMTNRGRGITVCSILDDVKIRLKSKEKAKNGQPHTYIVQKYIEKPLLYNRRKFDIRHYMLMTCVNGKFKGYWYEEGYLRTTSFEYNIKNCKDLYTHLTNDAIQKYSPDYGKFEKGNKVSYADFQKYLNLNYRGRGTKDKSEVDKYDFFGNILPKMKNMAGDAMRATYMTLSPKRYEHNFELFGLDFMLDEDMNVYLIEVNTNPCLQTSSPILNRLIPTVIENLFRITVDPLFPPPYQWPNQKKMQFGQNTLEENKFSLIFDEVLEEENLMKLYENAQADQNIGEIDEEDEYYEDEGKQWVEQN